MGTSKTKSLTTRREERDTERDGRANVSWTVVVSEREKTKKGNEERKGRKEERGEIGRGAR